jgi:8-oxo-dGTP diphosphatase
MSDNHRVFVGCCMVILNPSGTKALISRRKKEPDIDGWQIPGGTADYDNGENVMDAAIREAEEETGIKVKGAKLLCVMNSFYYGKQRPIHIGFVGQADSEYLPPNPEPHKSEDWQWVELDKLPQGKWFRMSKVALDFYIDLKLNPTTDRFFIDREYEQLKDLS